MEVAAVTTAKLQSDHPTPPTYSYFMFQSPDVIPVANQQHQGTEGTVHFYILHIHVNDNFNNSIMNSDFKGQMTSFSLLQYSSTKLGQSTH